MGHLSHLTMLLAAGVVFHAVLWARNAAFLWSRRRVILLVVGLAELWMLIADPIGGRWGAWFFDPNKVLGLWLFTVMPIEDLLGIAVVSSTAACAVLVFAYGPRRWV
jgi:lycopene cyclase domain-containing protein